MVAHNSKIPDRLRAKVPPMVLQFFEVPTFWSWFGLLLAVWMIYGPIVGPADHNGFRYLLAPLVCPLLPALYYIFFPYNPYHGLPAFDGPMTDFDKTDPDAARLVILFKSPAAHRAVWRIAGRVSAVEFVVMAALALVFRRSLSWSLTSPWLLFGFVGCVGASGIAVGADFISWGLRAWASNGSDGRPVVHQRATELKAMTNDELRSLPSQSDERTVSERGLVEIVWHDQLPAGGHRIVVAHYNKGVGSVRADGFVIEESGIRRELTERELREFL